MSKKAKRRPASKYRKKQNAPGENDYFDLDASGRNRFGSGHARREEKNRARNGHSGQSSDIKQGRRSGNSKGNHRQKSP